MRYFVIMGNTRVGSTWYQSAMHSLPGVFCTREIRWRMPYMDQVPPVHTYVDSTTSSIKERLEFGYRAGGMKKPASTLGAKLKFDPYGYAPPSAFGELKKILEEDVHVIFLRRSYFDIFQTWKAFGIRHLANPGARNAKSKGKQGEETPYDRELMNRFHKIHSVPLEQKRVFITGGGGVIARSLHNRYAGSDTLYYSIGDAIDDLLVLFYNDLFGLTVIQDRTDADVFYYEEIRQRFFPVTQRLGLPVDAEDCGAALNNAKTRKIEQPGVTLVAPDEGLREISVYLDNLFHQVRKGELETSDIVDVDERKGSVTFRLSEFPAILGRHEETAELVRNGSWHPSQIISRVLGPMGRVEGDYGRPLRIFRSLFASRSRAPSQGWPSQRPMYVPVAYAPKAPGKAATSSASATRT